MPSQNAAQSGENRLILEVRWGPFAHHKTILSPGQLLRVGRAEPSDFILPSDETLATEHFELSWDGVTCHLRDLGSRRGTLLEGEYIQSGVAPHGSWLRAGRTDFSIYFETSTQPLPQALPEAESRLSWQRRVLEYLRDQPNTLFMLLDAARNERILELLRGSVEDYRALYEGPQGDALELVAPYLVALPQNSKLLDTLVREGWGKSWGHFLSSEQSLESLRHHFRHWLMVEDPSGRSLYFRFYDPRVLDTFLSTCAIEDLLRFFGPVRSFCLEAKTPEILLRLSTHPQGLLRETFKLDDPT